MNGTQSQTEETRSNDSRAAPCCPICYVMEGMRERKRRHGGFFTHMLNAQIEVLQAFKSVLDQQISTLESRKSHIQEPKQATKIKVE